MNGMESICAPMPHIEPTESTTIDLNELRSEAERLVQLLKDRHSGLSTWNAALVRRLLSIKELIREAGL